MPLVCVCVCVVYICERFVGLNCNRALAAPINTYRSRLLPLAEVWRKDHVGLGWWWSRAFRCLEGKFVSLCFLSHYASRNERIDWGCCSFLCLSLLLSLKHHSSWKPQLRSNRSFRKTSSSLGTGTSSRWRLTSNAASVVPCASDRVLSRPTRFWCSLSLCLLSFWQTQLHCCSFWLAWYVCFKRGPLSLLCHYIPRDDCCVCISWNFLSCESLFPEV